MTDEKLRALERTFKESGSSEDELAWLRERVRQGESLDWESYSRLAELNVEAASEYLLARVERGDLEQGKLELAAYCGEEAACLGSKEQPVDPARELATWAQGLIRWGHPVGVRVAVAAAQAALAPWLSSGEDVQPYLAATLAAARWAICPCAEHRVEASRVAWEATWGASSDQAWSAAEAGTQAGNAAGAVAMIESWEAIRESIEQSASSIGVAALRQAVHDQTVPWALGFPDSILQGPMGSGA